MLKSMTAIAAVVLASSAALAAESPASRTVTVRGGQGDTASVVVTARGNREARPHQLTGADRVERKTITLRTGQGDFVQVPQR